MVVYFGTGQAWSTRILHPPLLPIARVPRTLHFCIAILAQGFDFRPTRLTPSSPVGVKGSGKSVRGFRCLLLGRLVLQIARCAVDGWSSRACDLAEFFVG